MTHPRIFPTPTPVDLALDAIDDLVRARGATPLAEADNHAELLTDLLGSGRVVGPRIHDARVAAICLGHGVTELWSTGRDFSWFPALRTRNPLV